MFGTDYVPNYGTKGNIPFFNRGDDNYFSPFGNFKWSGCSTTTTTTRARRWNSFGKFINYQCMWFRTTTTTTTSSTTSSSTTSTTCPLLVWRTETREDLPDNRDYPYFRYELPATSVWRYFYYSLGVEENQYRKGYVDGEPGYGWVCGLRLTTLTTTTTTIR
jgi:hypothetical protein